MVCRLAGAKPLSKPMLEYCYLEQTRSKMPWNINCNLYILIQENAFENVVWKMAAILSRPQYVNLHYLYVRTPVAPFTNMV